MDPMRPLKPGETFTALCATDHQPAVIVDPVVHVWADSGLDKFAIGTCPRHTGEVLQKILGHSK